VIVGTAEYMAPEMLQGNGYGLATDYWAFGCIIYEMLVGHPPFMHNNKQQLYRLIKYTDPNLSYGFLSDDAIDLISRLLEKNPVKRLGSLGQGANEIMQHTWFKDIDWQKMETKSLSSPYRPQLDNSFDVKYFDVEFTSQKLSLVPDQKC